MRQTMLGHHAEMSRRNSPTCRRRNCQRSRRNHLDSSQHVAPSETSSHRGACLNVSDPIADHYLFGGADLVVGYLPPSHDITLRKERAGCLMLSCCCFAKSLSALGLRFPAKSTCKSWHMHASHCQASMGFERALSRPAQACPDLRGHKGVSGCDLGALLIAAQCKDLSMATYTSQHKLSNVSTSTCKPNNKLSLYLEGLRKYRYAQEVSSITCQRLEPGHSLTDIAFPSAGWGSPDGRAGGSAGLILSTTESQSIGGPGTAGSTVSYMAPDSFQEGHLDPGMPCWWII